MACVGFIKEVASKKCNNRWHHTVRTRRSIYRSTAYERERITVNLEESSFYCYYMWNSCCVLFYIRKRELYTYYCCYWRAVYSRCSRLHPKVHALRCWSFFPPLPVGRLNPSLPSCLQYRRGTHWPMGHERLKGKREKKGEGKGKKRRTSRVSPGNDTENKPISTQQATRFRSSQTLAITWNECQKLGGPRMTAQKPRQFRR